MMWPATVPAATLSQSSGDQPNSWKIGPSVSPVSVTRPVTTTFAPPAERLDDRRHAEVGVGAEHAIADVGERAAGLHVAQRVAAADQLVEPAEDVVARDQPDPQLAAAAPAGARPPAPPRRSRAG